MAWRATFDSPHRAFQTRPWLSQAVRIRHISTPVGSIDFVFQTLVKIFHNFRFIFPQSVAWLSSEKTSRLWPYHAGFVPSFTNSLLLFPSAFTMKMPETSSWVDWKAIRRPSGDHAGWLPFDSHSMVCSICIHQIHMAAASSVGGKSNLPSIGRPSRIQVLA